MAIKCAIKPAVPASPTTTTNVNTVVINWTAPVTDNGAELSAYRVLIRHSDSATYSEELITCNGNQFVDTRTCTIPFTTLMDEPWLLTEGTSIFAKIVAINEIGESDQSARGNGATLVISDVPDRPFGLSREHQLTTTSQIGLMWNAPLNDGGQALIDYRIWFD